MLIFLALNLSVIDDVMLLNRPGTTAGSRHLGCDIIILCSNILKHSSVIIFFKSNQTLSHLSDDRAEWLKVICHCWANRLWVRASLPHTPKDRNACDINDLIWTRIHIRSVSLT